jgi:hypothetical protein
MLSAICGRSGIAVVVGRSPSGHRVTRAGRPLDWRIAPGIIGYARTGRTSLSASGTTRVSPASANPKEKSIARDKQQGTPVVDSGAEGTACNWLELLM